MELESYVEDYIAEGAQQLVGRARELIGGARALLKLTKTIFDFMKSFSLNFVQVFILWIVHSRCYVMKFYKCVWVI